MKSFKKGNTISLENQPEDSQFQLVISEEGSAASTKLSLGLLQEPPAPGKVAFFHTLNKQVIYNQDKAGIKAGLHARLDPVNSFSQPNVINTKPCQPFFKIFVFLRSSRD